MADGLCAEFARPEQMVDGLARVRALGIHRFDGHSPYPVKEAPAAMGLHRSRIPRWTFAGGLLGGLAAYGFEWWSSAVDAPFDLGGRPTHAPLAFLPVAFELTVLVASIATFAAFCWRTGLPRPWDPVFEVDGFERASVDRFFVAVDGEDPAFDADRVRAALESAGALAIRPLGRP